MFFYILSESPSLSHQRK